jgi:hypothetical protein
MSVSFVLLLARAAVRGGWALVTQATLGQRPYGGDHGSCFLHAWQKSSMTGKSRRHSNTNLRTHAIGSASHLARATANGLAMDMAAGAGADAAMADRTGTWP